MAPLAKLIAAFQLSPLLSLFLLICLPSLSCLCFFFLPPTWPMSTSSPLLLPNLLACQALSASTSTVTEPFSSEIDLRRHFWRISVLVDTLTLADFVSAMSLALTETSLYVQEFADQSNLVPRMVEGEREQVDAFRTVQVLTITGHCCSRTVGSKCESCTAYDSGNYVGASFCFDSENYAGASFCFDSGNYAGASFCFDLPARVLVFCSCRLRGTPREPSLNRPVESTTPCAFLFRSVRSSVDSCIPSHLRTTSQPEKRCPGTVILHPRLLLHGQFGSL